MVSGTGTSGDPFILSSLSDLELIGTTGYALSAYYKLGANIDASGTSDPGYNSGAGWLPVGNVTTFFTGGFDGNNKTISNLYINRPTLDRVGFFGVISTNNVKDLTLTNVDIEGKSYVGGLAGISTSSVTGCDVTGDIVGVTYAGGLIGYIGSNDVSITYCDVNADVTTTSTSSSNFAGGLIGFSTQNNNSLSINNCNYEGTVTTGLHYNGGFIGYNGHYNSTGIIDGANCTIKAELICPNTMVSVGGVAGYSFGTIQNFTITDDVIINTPNASEVGGIVGTISANTGNIKDCKSFINISGQEFVGGILGRATYNNYVVTMSKCFSAGNISGTNYVGGIVGYNGHYGRGSYLEKSISYGNVTASGQGGGGLIGSNRMPLVTNSFAIGNVNVTGQDGGGLIGVNNQAGSLTYCYSNGVVSAGSNAGGLVGRNVDTATATSCYWDTQTSGQETSALGTGKTTAEMKTESTYTNWDFSTPIWIIETYPNEGYPFLLSPPLYNIISETETPSGVDEPSIGGQPDPVSIEDSGTDLETSIWAGTMSLLLNDSGCLIDYEELKLFKEASDSGTDNETLNMKNNITILEAMEDYETLSIINYLPILDSGSIGEMFNLKNSFGLSESGIGNDTLSSLLVMLSLTDSNISVNETISLFNRLPIVDSGFANELPNLKNSFTLDESLVGAADIYPIHNFLGVLESNTILESLHIALETIVDDDGLSNDLVEVFVQMMLLESALGNDDIALTVYTLLSDYGSASETVRKELIKVIGSLIFMKQKSIELEFTNEKTFDVER